MYKDDYISAFGKLAPSEEWMADTLAKMRAAEAEQEAPGAAGSAGRPALRVSGKKHPRLRRAALPVAAAVALLAVPAAWFWGVAMRPAGSAAPAQYSLQSAGGAADEGQETEQAPRVAAAQDTAGTASSAAAAPETTEDAQAGARKEGRLLFAARSASVRTVISPMPIPLPSAEEQQLDLFLFGHTHRPLVDRRGRTLFLNPGSIGAPTRPSYGVVTIQDGQLDGRTWWLA